MNNYKTGVILGIIEFVLLLVIAGICGSIAQTIVGYSSGGCIVSIVVGFVGALLGSWMSVQLGWPELFTIQLGGNEFPVIWSIIGAVLFVMLVSLIGRQR